MAGNNSELHAWESETELCCAGNETGDERVVAATAGAGGRRLRPRGRRAVLAEGRALQRRGEERADRALPRQTASEELQQEDHCKNLSHLIPCKCLLSRTLFLIFVS